MTLTETLKEKGKIRVIYGKEKKQEGGLGGGVCTAPLPGVLGPLPRRLV